MCQAAPESIVLPSKRRLQQQRKPGRDQNLGEDAGDRASHHDRGHPCDRSKASNKTTGQQQYGRDSIAETTVGPRMKHGISRWKIPRQTSRNSHRHRPRMHEASDISMRIPRCRRSFDVIANLFEQDGVEFVAALRATGLWETGQVVVAVRATETGEGEGRDVGIV